MFTGRLSLHSFAELGLVVAYVYRLLPVVGRTKVIQRT